MGGRLPLVALLGAAVAVNWCPWSALCCSEVGPAQPCQCLGTSTGGCCQTGAEALEGPGSVQEDLGHKESPQATVQTAGLSSAVPGPRPGLDAYASPVARLAGAGERPGTVLSVTTPVPKGAGLGRPPAQARLNARRSEPPASAAAAEPWDKAHEQGVHPRPSAAGTEMPFGRTSSPLFSARSQTKTADPTSAPLPGTAPLGVRMAQDPPSLVGSSSPAKSPAMLPGSARWDTASWDPAPAHTSAATEPTSPGGQSAPPPGPPSPEPPGAESPAAALSQGRAAGMQTTVTSPLPSVPVTGAMHWASTGLGGAPHTGGEGLRLPPRGTATTMELAFTDRGTGASPASPTESSGTAVHPAASAPGQALGTSQTPTLQLGGSENVTQPPRDRSSSLAQPAVETEGTPDSSTTAAPSAPELQSSTHRLGPLGGPQPVEDLGHKLVEPASAESAGHRDVDEGPEALNLPLSEDLRTEEDPQAMPWAEPLPGSAPGRTPGAYAGTRWPLANLTAPTPFSDSTHPLLPPEQLSTWAEASHPTAAAQLNGSLTEHAQEPSLSTPAPAPPTLAWLPNPAAGRTRVPGTGEPHSTVPSVGPSFLPPFSPTPGAKQPSLAPVPALEVTSQEGMFPGAYSVEALPATTAPPASQTSRAGTLAGMLPSSSTVLSPAKTPAPPGLEWSSPFSVEKDVSGSPTALGPLDLSIVTTQSPLWDTAATSPLAHAHWRAVTEQLGPRAVPPPDRAGAGAELGNSSHATDAPALSGAGGNLPASSTRALFSPTVSTPEPTQTDTSTVSPAGNRSFRPPVAATPRVWGTDVTDPTSTARVDVPLASTQLRAAMSPVTPGPAGTTDGQPSPVTARGAQGRAQSVFVVEDQPPLLRAPLLRVPCELALDMDLVGIVPSAASAAHPSLVQSFNETVAPLFTAVPGFQRLEVKSIRDRRGVLEYDALFAAEQLRGQLWGLAALLNQTVLPGATRSGLHIANAPVLWNVVLAQQLDPCVMLFSCHAGFECVSSEDGNASCTSLCHRGYCKNRGLCIHLPEQAPACQCPAGSDYWFMGLRCDYKVTQQSLLGMACGVLLVVALVGAAIACLVVRRFKVLLLEARVDQTKSSYRRFCRLDDVAAHYWSQSWLASANSLDNPAFSNSEELLHLQMLDHSCCSCDTDAVITDSYRQPEAPLLSTVCRPSFHSDWETSSSSINEPMIDSGKASDISVSSWPMEPIQWTPFPILHQLSRQRLANFCYSTFSLRRDLTS
ncbi:uncharacterized protein LOC142021533 isoform X2 [Carettochelys insculpta]|uniref:uncharacterized protein LOC142021533 isoform X2 n=1 Tax=Carettochelys insculpta TaxID=44489 RepID=UPI003EB938A4